MIHVYGNVNENVFRIILYQTFSIYFSYICVQIFKVEIFPENYLLKYYENVDVFKILSIVILSNIEL